MKENDYAKYYRFDHAAAGEEFAPATSTTTPARAIAEEIWNLDLPRSGKANTKHISKSALMILSGKITAALST